MPARRKRPEPAPRRRCQPPAGERWAAAAAWVIFVACAATFASVVWRQSRSEPGTEARARRPPVEERAPRAAHAPAAASPPSAPAPPPAPATAAPPEDLLRRQGKAGKAASARVAIIIDDIGRDLDAVERLTRMPYRLTLAVIPHLPHSKRSAELANRRGYEVMLHLPMEPLDYPREDPGTGAVTTRMPASEVRRAVLDGLAAVPHARGVNNHMGSRLTADRARMRVVLETIAGTPCFFVDSRTSTASVAYALARELKVPAAERSVFLDDAPERAAVKAQLDRLVDLARSRGQAIAIGHPHPVTLDVLAEGLPAVIASGIEVVFVSKLVS